MHHPGEVVTGSAVSGQGTSLLGWIVLLAILTIFGIIIYFIIRAGRNKF